MLKKANEAVQDALGHAAKTIVHDYGDSSSIMVIVFFVP